MLLQNPKLCLVAPSRYYIKVILERIIINNVAITLTTNKFGVMVTEIVFTLQF